MRGRHHVRRGREAQGNRRIYAEDRAIKRSKRTAQQQLLLLDARPGESARERTKLTKELAS